MYRAQYVSISSTVRNAPCRTTGATSATHSRTRAHIALAAGDYFAGLFVSCDPDTSQTDPTDHPEGDPPRWSRDGSNDKVPEHNHLHPFEIKVDTMTGRKRFNHHLSTVIDVTTIRPWSRLPKPPGTKRAAFLSELRPFGRYITRKRTRAPYYHNAMSCSHL